MKIAAYNIKVCNKIAHAHKFNVNLQCQMSVVFHSALIVICVFSLSLLKVKICFSVTDLFRCQGSCMCRFVVK